MEIKEMGIQTSVQANTKMTQPRIHAHAKCEAHTEVRGGGGGRGGEHCQLYIKKIARIYFQN